MDSVLYCSPVTSLLLFKRFLALWGYVVPAFSVSPLNLVALLAYMPTVTIP